MKTPHIPYSVRRDTASGENVEDLELFVRIKGYSPQVQQKSWFGHWSIQHQEEHAPLMEMVFPVTGIKNVSPQTLFFRHPVTKQETSIKLFRPERAWDYQIFQHGTSPGDEIDVNVLCDALKNANLKNEFFWVSDLLDRFCVSSGITLQHPECNLYPVMRHLLRKDPELFLLISGKNPFLPIRSEKHQQELLSQMKEGLESAEVQVLEQFLTHCRGLEQAYSSNLLDRALSSASAKPTRPAL